MVIVHVHVHVKPESVVDFRQATLENARYSVQEPDIAPFDVVQRQDDPTRFVLIDCRPPLGGMLSCMPLTLTLCTRMGDSSRAQKLLWNQKLLIAGEGLHVASSAAGTMERRGKQRPLRAQLMCQPHLPLGSATYAGRGNGQ
jgi:hypothetical protein